MIRVRTAQTPEKLEALLNEQEKDGFKLKTLSFRGYEAVAVLEMTGGIIKDAEPIIVHDHPSNWQPPKDDDNTPAEPTAPIKRGPGRPPKNSFKRRGR